MGKTRLLKMTVQEYRADWYKQGFIIQEGIVPSTQQLQILIMKIDTDGLRFEHRILPSFNVFDKVNNGIYVDTVKEAVVTINNLITNRHAQSISNCQHDPIMLGTAKACSKCMGKFGDRIHIDINYN